MSTKSEPWKKGDPDRRRDFAERQRRSQQKIRSIIEPLVAELPELTEDQIRLEIEKDKKAKVKTGKINTTPARGRTTLMHRGADGQLMGFVLPDDPHELDAMFKAREQELKKPMEMAADRAKTTKDRDLAMMHAILRYLGAIFDKDDRLLNEDELDHEKLADVQNTSSLTKLFGQDSKLYRDTRTGLQYGSWNPGDGLYKCIARAKKLHPLVDILAKYKAG